MTRAEQRQEWESKIAAYRASGQSAKEWCAANVFSRISCGTGSITGTIDL